MFIADHEQFELLLSRYSPNLYLNYTYLNIRISYFIKLIIFSSSSSCLINIWSAWSSSLALGWVLFQCTLNGIMGWEGNCSRKRLGKMQEADLSWPTMSRVKWFVKWYVNRSWWWSTFHFVPTWSVSKKWGHPHSNWDYYTRCKWS